MYLAHDPYTQETVVLDNAWPWAFLDINAGAVPSTLNDIILARLTDHCAACGAMRDGVAHWRGTALPINSFLDASTNIPDEPQMYLDLLPFMWHDATLTTVDQETQEYCTTAFHDAIHDEVGRSFSRAVSEPLPCLVSTIALTERIMTLLTLQKAPFTPRPSPSSLMRLPAELRFMIMKELSQPTSSDVYGCSLGTTRSKDGVVSTENLSWALHWTRLRAVCRQLKLEADAHICRWVNLHEISVHAWDLTGSLDMPLALFAQVTRLTVFFDVMDICKGDIDLEPTEVNFALLQDYYKALHFIAMMPRLSSLTIRWRADTKDAMDDDLIGDLQFILLPDIFQALYTCSPTYMECLESITFVGFDTELWNIRGIEELCETVGAPEQLQAVEVIFVGCAKAEYVA